MDLVEKNLILILWPVIVVSEGKIVEQSFEQLAIEKTKVLEYIKKLNLQIKKLLVLTLSKDGTMFFQVFGQKCQSKKTNLKEGI